MHRSTPRQIDQPLRQVDNNQPTGYKSTTMIDQPTSKGITVNQQSISPWQNMSWSSNPRQKYIQVHRPTTNKETPRIGKNFRSEKT